MTRSSTTDAVRNYAALQGTLTKKEARESLGLGVDITAQSFENLVKSGHLRRIGHGLYQFIDTVETPPAKIMDKIWRAMKISTAFTAQDIAKLADSSAAYVYKRFRQYHADGYIRRAGVKNTGRHGHQKLWRLTGKGKQKAQNPRVQTWKPDPVVRATVNLNRLICSGAAMRDKAIAMEALNQVHVVTRALMEIVEEK